MKLTASTIEGYIYDRLRNSTLNGLISGSVYREGMRPRDSRLEDAVVVFTAGLSEQIETGELTVKIYVPDVDPYQNGTLVRDARRVAEIETAASSWVEGLRTAQDGFLFSLADTIRSRPDDEIGQHYVSVHISYRYFNS